MRFIIYGAGGVGGTIGAELHLSGESVVLIARGAHLETIKQAGLHYETPFRSETLPIPAVGHPREILFNEDDVVILTMKSQHTRDALNDLRQFAGERVPIICCQNGVANEDMAQRRFRNVYAMVVYLPGESLEPGFVRCHSLKKIGILDAGLYPSGVDPFIEGVAARLEASNMGCLPTVKTMAWKYGKLIQNTGNALAACRKGEDTQALRTRLQDEAMRCYEAGGIDFKTIEEIRERRAGIFEIGKIDGVGRAGGSSWQSLANGRPDIETDYLNGEIVRLGRFHGVPTPANAAMQNLMNRMIRSGVAPNSLSLAEIEALIEAES